jgi:plastocyanin
VLARKTAAAVAGGVIAALAVPGLAQAATKTVTMGVPGKSQGAFQKLGSQTVFFEVNDFFPHGVTIHVGDSVKFAPVGFHSVDIPPRGSSAVPLVSPTAQMISGVNDAAGQPFWFNGNPQVGFTPSLFAGSLGKKVKFTGAKRVSSGLPLGTNPKPMTVKFTKAGNYTYFCNVHPGMKGIVRVKKSGKVPSSKADAKALKRQVARDLTTSKGLANASVPANTVDIGTAGAHGEERYAMLPDKLTVAPGTRVNFRMSPGSFEAHTATAGPGNPDDKTSYVGSMAATFQGAPTFDPRGAYPSEAPGAPAAGMSPVLHGNGFWNSGILDSSTATPQLGSSNAVTFNTPGTYVFHCLIHTNMAATITVQ